MNLRLWILALSLVGLMAAAGSVYLAGRRHAAERLEPRLAEMSEALARSQAQAALQGEVAEARLAAAARRGRAAAAVQESIVDARTSEDGHAPLDPIRAARLRRADRRLCDAGPDLAGCRVAGPAP